MDELKTTADISKITDEVREIVAKVLSLPVEEISPTAHFYEDLEGDSLQKLEAIFYIESKFNLQLTNDEAAGETVEALVESVARHVS